MLSCAPDAIRSPADVLTLVYRYLLLRSARHDTARMMTHVPPKKTTQPVRFAVSNFYDHEECWDYVFLQHARSSEEDLRGAQGLKESFISDRTALTVFAALLMTVDFAALLLSSSSYRLDNAYNDQVSILYFICFGGAASSSLSAVIMGTMNYISIIKWTGEHVRDVVHFIEDATPVYLTPIGLCNTACILTLVGATAGVYLNQGVRPMIACGAPAIPILLLALYYGGIALNGPFEHIRGVGIHDPKRAKLHRASTRKEEEL